MNGYRDRLHAGRILAEEVAVLGLTDPVVVALPRGGVPVGYQVARRLDAPLDVVLVRKLGVPWQPELGMGAIAERGVMLLNPEVVRAAGVAESQIDAVRRQEEAELQRRARLYRGSRPAERLQGRQVVVCDDGLATGFTARAAIESARRGGAAQVVLAVPVGAAETVAELRRVADRVVCPLSPRRFMAVGAWYADFSQTSDDEVIELLERTG